MNVNPWSTLAEFTHTYVSDDVKQSVDALQSAVKHLSLPEMFVRRLGVAFTETMDKHLRRADGDQVISTVNVRVLSNSAGSNAQKCSATWGFFFIETDQMIELYLYQDQA